jgi:hypothetical protein
MYGNPTHTRWRKKNKNNGVKIFNDVDSATLHVVGNYFIKVPPLSTLYLGHFI